MDFPRQSSQTVYDMVDAMFGKQLLELPEPSAPTAPTPLSRCGFASRPTAGRRPQRCHRLCAPPPQVRRENVVLPRLPAEALLRDDFTDDPPLPIAHNMKYSSQRTLLFNLDLTSCSDVTPSFTPSLECKQCPVTGMVTGTRWKETRLLRKSMSIRGRQYVRIADRTALSVSRSSRLSVLPGVRTAFSIYNEAEVEVMTTRHTQDGGIVFSCADGVPVAVLGKCRCPVRGSNALQLVVTRGVDVSAIILAVFALRNVDGFLSYI